MKAGRGLLTHVVTLAAAALCAPMAHAGSYDVLSCTIDGGYHTNNAWVAGNSPAGNGAYVTDATCPKSGDPLGVSLAANTAYANGTFAALWLPSPPQAAITNYTRTREGGAYSARYRFNSGGGRFTFRVRLRPNDSYPYARGTSKAVRIVVA